MRIAYLITAYNNYEHLKRLIDVLNDENATFFIHIDKKSPLPRNITANEKIHFIKRIRVWWGGWSHQQAILNLMKEAATQNFDYYCLLSGADYPIRPKSFFYNKLEEGGEYFSIIKGFHEHKPESRIQLYYFDGFDRRNNNSIRTNFFLKLEKIVNRFFTKKQYPFTEVFHGPTWWTLSQGCVNFVLDFLDRHPSYIRFFKTSFCPEECLIYTILGNSPYHNKGKGYLTYTDWSKDPSSPALITNEHIELFKTCQKFEISEGGYQPCFARKFTDQSQEIVNCIDKELRI